MEKLIEGNIAFKSEIFELRRELFERLAQGQSPKVLFITCSDSRIDPNLITRSDPGELFIIRNAGNIVAPIGTGVSGEASTIEYAVEVLGVTDIIICGHTHCGAMVAILHPEKLAKLPAVSGFLAFAEATRRIVERKHAHLTGDERVEEAVKVNVLVQLDHLRTHPSVAARLAENSIHLHGWIYRLETGEILVHDPARGAFVAYDDVTPDPASAAYHPDRPSRVAKPKP